MGGYYSSGFSRNVIRSTGWIDLDQYSGRWHAFKNAVMNFLAPQIATIFFD
jgi:hypothetical protein